MANDSPPDFSQSRDPQWHVSRCTCGGLTLRLGPFRVEFTPDEFAQLHRLVTEAMTEFRIAPTSRRASKIRVTGH